ncbi:multidrug ABC transporter ATP-binding protein [Streptomyces spiroverticillatus]|uniref:Multidrug ABC transporter ATP-binding protein n=1 Tax=Streptomyces finlayi TaxID=67296 RepID=A0A918X1T9_9ACTN|nr:ATP-binding cassette domain-containing protein [Streptomyces finlayi]GHA21713.1 multidrug ABC transporter ATP-binding protein [Streptomyces spiroverticillatus]GHD03971.1 multidrug ABC transporter ATP-binding protein [Streptomyces finlayi]
MITLRGLTKRYGETVAVDDLTLDVEEGRVTGFLGPNGAGKSTTMRMILGLDHPTAGTALIDGRPYAQLPCPLREVGALLDAKALHPARSARGHLNSQARSNGIPVRRVDEVLEQVGLAKVARKRAGAFSLGMYQRLGIAGALLGDPKVLVLDEPVNGLDPEGVRWVRELVREQAARGRTVFLSSHLMSEMQLTADRLVVIGRGHLLADLPMAELLARSASASVHVRTAEPEELRLLAGKLDDVDVSGETTLVARGTTSAAVGDLAHHIGVRLHELHPVTASLEQAYMELTAQSVEYGTTGEPKAGL